MDENIYSLQEPCKKISDKIEERILKLLEPYGINKHNIDVYINSGRLKIEEYYCNRIPGSSSIIIIVLDDIARYKIKKTFELNYKEESGVYYTETKFELMDVDK